MSSNIEAMPAFEPDILVQEDMQRRAADAAATKANAVPSLRPKADWSDFIEKTVQSLASGYPYGNVPNYYKMAAEIWSDREAFWDSEDKKAREAVYLQTREETLKFLHDQWRLDQRGEWVVERIRRKAEEARKEAAKNETPDAR